MTICRWEFFERIILSKLAFNSASYKKNVLLLLMSYLNFCLVDFEFTLVALIDSSNLHLWKFVINSLCFLKLLNYLYLALFWCANVQKIFMIFYCMPIMSQSYLDNFRCSYPLQEVLKRINMCFYMNQFKPNYDTRSKVNYVVEVLQQNPNASNKVNFCNKTFKDKYN